VTIDIAGGERPKRLSNNAAITAVWRVAHRRTGWRFAFWRDHNVGTRRRAGRRPLRQTRAGARSTSAPAPTRPASIKLSDAELDTITTVFVSEGRRNDIPGTRRAKSPQRAISDSPKEEQSMTLIEKGGARVKDKTGGSCGPDGCRESASIGHRHPLRSTWREAMSKRGTRTSGAISLNNQGAITIAAFQRPLAASPDSGRDIGGERQGGSTGRHGRRGGRRRGGQQARPTPRGDRGPIQR